MSVVVNGFHQHLVSYYSLDDAMAGRLRCPVDVPELRALDISPEYLIEQSFRFPPVIAMVNGIPRFQSEGSPPISPHGINHSLPNHSLPYPAPSIPGIEMHDGYATTQPMRLEYSVPNRIRTGPMSMPDSHTPSTASYHMPGSAGSMSIFDEMSPSGPSHMRPGTVRTARPSSSRSGRYDPYNATSPRSSSASLRSQNRRPSASQQDQTYPRYDVKPVMGTNGALYYSEYDYYGNDTSQAMAPLHSPSSYPTPQYSGWQPPSVSRMVQPYPRHTTDGPPQLEMGHPNISNTPTQMSSGISATQPQMYPVSQSDPAQNWGQAHVGSWDQTGNMHVQSQYHAPHPPQAPVSAPAPPPPSAPHHPSALNHPSAPNHPPVSNQHQQYQEQPPAPQNSSAPWRDDQGHRMPST